MSGMRCYFCDGPLQHTGIADTSEKDGEMAVSYLCPGCGKKYQTQLTTIAIFAYAPGQEQTLLLLRQCRRCKQLYRDGARHMCEAYSSGYDVCGM
jgi:hypothetical protein